LKVNLLRWELFRTKASEGENLPPTSGALLQHVRRARRAALIGKSFTPTPNIPLPEADNGWKLEDGRLTAVTSEVLPAPQSILELAKCGCKGDCLSKKCSCRDNKLPCSPICKCKDNYLNCINPARRDHDMSESSDSEEDDF